MRMLNQLLYGKKLGTLSRDRRDCATRTRKEINVTYNILERIINPMRNDPSIYLWMAFSDIKPPKVTVYEYRCIEDLD